MMIPDFLHFLVNPDILTRYGWKFVDGFFVTIKLVALSYTAGFFLSIFITLKIFGIAYPCANLHSVFSWFAVTCPVVFVLLWNRVFYRTMEKRRVVVVFPKFVVVLFIDFCTQHGWLSGRNFPRQYAICTNRSI